jgi:hypothetical protein
MAFEENLRQRLEQVEVETVGKAFGGPTDTDRDIYSVPSIRDLTIEETNQLLDQIMRRRAAAATPAPTPRR